MHSGSSGWPALGIAQAKSVYLPIVEKTGYYFEHKGLDTWIAKSLEWLGE